MPTAFASLAEILGSGPLSLSEVVRIFTPIAETVDHAAGQGVLHPRLRPSGIVFDEQNNPALVDTALATRGAPEYMSPEEIRGETTDARGDVYSLAALAYHALTGRRPFEGVTEQGIMFKQAMDLPRPPRELQPDLPEAIDAVMLKALAKEPGDRYQTPTEFVRALSAAVESHRALETIRPEAPEEPGPITPTAPPSASELTKWAAEEEATPAATPPTAQPAAVKKRRLGTWLVAGAGTLALFLCAWFAIASLRVLIPLVAEPARTRGFLPDKVEIVRYSPDGQLILTLHDDDILRV